MTLTLTPQIETLMLGYFGEDTDWEPPAGAFGGMLTSLEELLRFPVRNTIERDLMDSFKYAMIMQRDGGCCRVCYSAGPIEIDHIFPRSAFKSYDLDTADRSDNLMVLCADCNQRKANFVSVFRKRPGVVAACWECRNPGPEDPWEYEEWCQGIPELPHMVYCGRHGNVGGRVPDLSWVL